MEAVFEKEFCNLQIYLSFFMLSKSRPVSKEEGGGGGGATVALAPHLLPPPPPPTTTEVHFFLLISDLKQSEVGILFYSYLLIV